MKNLSFTSKILSLVAAILCLVIIGTGVHMAAAIRNGTSDSTLKDAGDYDVVFTGSINLNDEDYDIVLKGKDGSFTVDANNMKNVIDGNYVFTDGQGWTLLFNDALGMNIRTHYDSADKAHKFIYALDLGSRGAGNLELSKEDKSFSPASDSWNDIPTFTGTADLGVIAAEMRLICKADGSFHFFSTNFGQYIPSLEGTYAEKEGKYVFTIGEEEIETVLQDGLLTATLPVSLPVMGVTGIPTLMVQDILSVG